MYSSTRLPDKGVRIFDKMIDSIAKSALKERSDSGIVRRHLPFTLPKDSLVALQAMSPDSGGKLRLVFFCVEKQ